MSRDSELTDVLRKMDPNMEVDPVHIMTSIIEISKIKSD